MTAYSPNLGDIVAMHSHPFNENQTKIIITGEHQLLSPLMVVAEIQKDTSTRFDEKNGEEISRVGFGKCKCLWFSHKTNQFEEAWLDSKLLKRIEKAEHSINPENFFQRISIDNSKPSEPKYKRYSRVVFKTNNIELSKRKSTLTCDESSIKEHNEEKFTVTACLSFVSPVMEIIQISELKDSEQKESKYNAKTGEEKKLTANWLAKCKWFNPFGDKFSEKILPLDVLMKLQETEETLLEKIRHSIRSFKETPNEYEYLKLMMDENKVETILKPKDILYRSGTYVLKAFDYLTNNIRYIDISEEKFRITNRFAERKVPTFKYIESGLLDPLEVFLEKLEAINFAISSKRLLRVKYCNNQQKISVRTLKNIELKQVNENSDIVVYMKAHCLLKNETRTFKVDDLLKIEVLELDY